MLKNHPLALGGLMTALGVVLLSVFGMLGVGTYAGPILAAACLIPLPDRFGPKAGWCAWAATALLALLLSADKEEGFFYLALGCYPLLKPRFDRIGSRRLRFLAKLLYFAAVVALLYWFLMAVLGLSALLKDLEGIGRGGLLLMYLLLVIILLLYDRLVEVYVRLYRKRFKGL